MDLFKDVWASFSKTNTTESTTGASKLEDIINKSKPANKAKATGRMSIIVVDNAAEAKVDLQSFQPATALKDDQIARIMPKSRNSQTMPNKTNKSFLDITRNSVTEDMTNSRSIKRRNESVTSTEDMASQMSSCSSVPVRLQRSLSMNQINKAAPKDVINIRDNCGELTLEFKKVLLRLAKKRLQEEVKEFDKAQLMTQEVCYTLVKGALEYLSKLEDDQLYVDGSCTMIPEEYQVNAKKADLGRTETDILHFQIDRMRGESMRLGTEQTARKETKETKVTSEQEKMLRKLVEVGFLLNEPPVALTIARFIEEDKSIREFRKLGLRQRSRETGRVLMNKLFTQDYSSSESAKPKRNVTEEEESEIYSISISDIII